MKNSKNSFTDPMSADVQSVRPVVNPQMSAAYKQEQNELMSRGS